MPNIWSTADFHFGHSNIIRYCNRPFRSVEEMDQTILDRLNASVKANDILYFHTWPARRDLSLRHAGLESLPSWSVTPVRTFSWEPP
jgi:calcineurin-like phosphoesterase family protein